MSRTSFIDTQPHGMECDTMSKIPTVASRTARGGLQNEEDVAHAFSSFGQGQSASNALSFLVSGWLRTLGHDPAHIRSVIAQTHKDTHKRDLTVRVNFGQNPPSARVHKISIKMLSSRRGSGANHLQRLTVDSFVTQFGAPDDVASLLKLYTGETTPTATRSGLSDNRRVKANEFSQAEQQLLVDWFTQNSRAILEGIFQGPEPIYAPGWILIIKKQGLAPSSVLKTMAQAIDIYAEGGVRIEGTSFRIGHIIVQRKGGGRGATDLQFKCPFGRL